MFLSSSEVAVSPVVLLFQSGQQAFVHGVALFVGGESPGLDFVNVLSHRLLDDVRQPGVLLGVLRDEVGEQPQKVTDHLDLSIAERSRPDADSGHTHLLGYQLGKWRRNGLENDAEYASLFQ